MNSRWKHSLTAAGLLAVAVLAWGCSMKLETGYQYRPLNASSAQRRAYYAPAFSPEKSAADQEKKGGSAPSFGSQH
jgi:hypothetical protein